MLLVQCTHCLQENNPTSWQDTQEFKNMMALVYLTLPCNNLHPILTSERWKLFHISMALHKVLASQVSPSTILSSRFSSGFTFIVKKIVSNLCKQYLILSKKIILSGCIHLIISDNLLTFFTH